MQKVCQNCAYCASGPYINTCTDPAKTVRNAAGKMVKDSFVRPDWTCAQWTADVKRIEFEAFIDGALVEYRARRAEVAA